MQIREIYELQHNVGQLGGSYTSKFYIDVREKSKSSLVVKHKHKQSFINQLQKYTKQFPGPGQYTINPQDKNTAKKMGRTIDFAAESKKPSKNCIQDIIRSKQNIPGVGKYQLNFDKFEKERDRYFMLGEKTKKMVPTFKNTILGEALVDCINVGPGSYNASTTLESLKKSFRQSINQQKSNKHKKSQSLPKLPHPQSYYPMASSYNTFDKIQSKSKHEEDNFKTSHVDRQKRFSDVKEIGPGPKYSLIAEWSPKQSKAVFTVPKNIFKSTKSIIPPSVYH